MQALARISKYLSKDKFKILMKSFVTSQFNYCPLTWTFHNRTLNNKINKLHERAPWLMYKDTSLSFQKLLGLDNSMAIHHRNIQRCKRSRTIFLQCLWRISLRIMPIFLRKNRCCEISKVRTDYYGTETIRFRGPKTWDMVPQPCRNLNSKSSHGNQLSVHAGCVKHLFQN